MEVIKPAFNELRGGTFILTFRNKLSGLNTTDNTLDLSDIVFMDSTGFRLVFDFLPKFRSVVPPKNPHIIEMYNVWLDSKKGLTK